MSLDITLTKETEAYNLNLTHNYTKLATAAGVYYPVWRPDEIGLERAKDLIPFLKAGIKLLQDKQEHFQHQSPKNGWGNYQHFVTSLIDYLQACEKEPYALIHTCK